MRPRRRFPWAPLLAIVGVLMGLGITATLASPRVAGVSPAPDRTHVSSEAPIEMVFNTEMNAASVESLFRLEPPVPGRIEWAQGNRLMRFRPEAQWAQGGRVRVVLGPGARSTRGLPLWRGHDWSFTVGAPSVLFISAGEATPNVYRAPATSESGPLTQVTAVPKGVYDFAASPDGTRVIYAALRDDGGADLRSTGVDGSDDQSLLDCPGEACVSPAFSPDGAWLAFERRPLSAQAAGPPLFGSPRVWLLNLNTGESKAVGDANRVTGTPKFTRTGALAYMDFDLAAVVLTDLSTQAATYVPNTSGDMGTWAPDGSVLVFPEITFPPEPTAQPSATPANPTATPPDEPPHEDRETFYSHLLRVIVSTNQSTDLSNETFVEDASPSFSPSGSLIAFARRYLDNDRFTPGRQLWIMNADGSEARPITSEPNVNHSALTWSPDGSAIVFMKYNMSDFASPASIWIVNADGSNPRQLAPAGYLPEWIP